LERTREVFAPAVAVALCLESFLFEIHERVFDANPSTIELSMVN